MSRLLRSVSAVAAALSLACCGMVPSLSATSCLRGAQVRPGMTEPQVLALLGKPYSMAFGRGEFRYRWMNNEGGRDVKVQFELAADGKVEHSVVTSVVGSCDGKSF